MKPFLLDGFCCAGGAARGYQRAGFYVIGVDNEKRYAKRYAGDEFHHGDVFDVVPQLVRDLLADGETVALHMSPPCQHASAGTRAMRSRGDSRHPALIEPTRAMCRELGLPYVIENVKGAALIEPIVLCGTMFGLTADDDDGTPLEMWRHRLFESSAPLSIPVDCQHGAYSQQVAGSYGGARRDKHEARNVRHGGYVPSKRVQQQLLDIDWMTEQQMYQALPPAYTEWIGGLLMQSLVVEAVAA